MAGSDGGDRLRCVGSSTGPPDIADARRRVGNKVALQGNMDPSMLYAPAPRIEEEVATILAGFGQGRPRL